MLEEKHPDFWKVVDRNAQVTKVAGGFQFTEGPVFSRRGYLLFSDIPPEKIMKWERGQLTTFREKSNRANGLTFDHQGRLLTCEGGGRVTRTEKNGSITVLAAQGLKAPNDLVYNIDQTIYFTDLPGSKVYKISRKGDLAVVAEDCVGPNGVALSPNQQQLYVADGKRRMVRIYGIRPDGTLTNGRHFADTRCDGLKTDEAGNVWCTGEGGIWIFDAAGKHLGIIRTPENPANCCFGSGFSGLYITARTSLYHVPTKVPGTRTF
ncbi:MAG: SMP-30/gluconolactonase/LRE family protein [Acidobacteria bacterium]|nr:SMP-30/gluconolactonase/LRE family protein [Acidobacteriota bacterium]